MRFPQNLQLVLIMNISRSTGIKHGYCVS